MDRQAIKVVRFFSKDGFLSSMAGLETESWVAEVLNKEGEILFRREGLIFPKGLGWNQLTVNVVAQHYMMDYEFKWTDVLTRLVTWYAEKGADQGYFERAGESYCALQDELSWLLYHRVVAFNSPAWYNLGVKGHRQQVAACFLSSVKDDMDDIINMSGREMNIFRWGSGSGMYLGGMPLDRDNPEKGLDGVRSRHERVYGKGLASGPLSYMQGWDTSAGTIKSGGRTRRAAALRVMGDRHADLIEFIQCKTKEERVAKDLIAAGYDPGFNVEGGAYDRVQYQNANNATLLSDEFMGAVIKEEDWELFYTRPDRSPEGHKEGNPFKKIPARDVLLEIAEGLWETGDPGPFFYDNINRWNTVPHVGPIQGANPCAEVLQPPDTSCNLCAIRVTALEELTRFQYELPLSERAEYPPDFPAQLAVLEKISDILVVAMDISIDASEYPDEHFVKRTHELRPLGIGFCDIGTYLMKNGVGYGTNRCTSILGALTGRLTGAAYKRSSELAQSLGHFAEYNEENMLRVLSMHSDTCVRGGFPDSLRVVETFKKVLDGCKQFGVRNNQVSVMMPTGTVSFALGATTTGVEPVLSFATYKTFVGGGGETMINEAFVEGMAKHGYPEKHIEKIRKAVLEGKGIKEMLLPGTEYIFETALGDANGDLVLKPERHINGLSAIQANISGGISKTLNLPNSITVEEIADLIVLSWQKGLKVVTFYRDGSRSSQPVQVKKKDGASPEQEVQLLMGDRFKIPNEMPSIRQKLELKGYDGMDYDIYLHVGMYMDKPVEIFITLGKTGHTLSGLFSSLATSWSIAMQYGVPLEVLVNKFEHSAFNPEGIVAGVGIVKSPLDAICRWLRLRFFNEDSQDTEKVVKNLMGMTPKLPDSTNVQSNVQASVASNEDQCPKCGNLMSPTDCFCRHCGQPFGCSG